MTTENQLTININGIHKTLSFSDALSLCYQLVSSNSAFSVEVAAQLFAHQQFLEKDRFVLFQLLFNFSLKKSDYQTLLSFSQQAINEHENWEIGFYANAIANRYLRNPEQAKQSLKQALKLAPNNIEWRRLLGRMHQEFGDFPVAKQQYDQCLALDKFDVESYWLRSDITPQLSTKEAEHLTAYVSATAEKNSDKAAYACFTLYRHFNAIKDYTTAFEYLTTGNNILARLSPFNCEKERQEHRVTEQVFSSSQLGNKPHHSLGNRSIFICGLPRSGTTLVEQILASHSDINAGDELFYLAQASQEVIASLQIRKPFPEWVTDIKDNDWQAIGNRYLDKCQHLAQGKWLTDKMPLNYKAIGIIHHALPDAKIIYCRRNREDVIWGCYKQILGQGNGFSNSLEHLDKIHKAHAELMHHWLTHLSDKILVVDYEELVSDQAAVTKKLCQFIGINYQAEMLSFYNNKHAVHTVSSAQVRKAINNSHIGDWQKYQQLLPIL